ncbi:MAG: dephospho-CoA kinase [Flavobacteriales bacterium]|nr:MAG: dephospho-CoA kinase [Flavobacteriales bacterium]
MATRPLKLGVTGGMGSGKTTVCRVLEVLGAPIFSADLCGRELLDTDPVLRAAVAKRFGDGLYRTGSLDRKALAEIVFNDASALAELNAMVHPRVIAAFTTWCDEQQAPYVVMESALMPRSGSAKLMDHLVVVQAPYELRLRRVMMRDGSDEAQVRARMARQAGDAELASLAGTVIDNSGAVLVIPQVLELHQALLKGR